jgi:hypothetical protein
MSSVKLEKKTFKTSGHEALDDRKERINKELGL